MTRRVELDARLLSHTRSGRSMRLAEHLAVHGRAPDGRREDLVDACERSGLLGRGGALFPTAVKLRAVAAAPGRTSVVVNVCEGEPMSAKDRLLAERVPHLVLDGAQAAATAVGAQEIVVALSEAAPAARLALEAALAERGDERTVLATVPDTFLSGEESALIRFLNGGPALPTVVPPRPHERGLHRRPTLVQNAETLAHLALVARHGSAWFRALGAASHPGTVLVTLGGCVRGKGVHEVATGVSIAEVLAATGGTTEEVRAVLVGGFHGTWIDGDAALVTLDRAGLARHGATLGAGVLVALPRSACPVAEVTRVVGWLAAENARQCGPCVNGLGAIVSAFDELKAGRAETAAAARLERWSRQIAGRGACHHPDGVGRFVRSALSVFEPELELHRRFGPCEACDAPPVLRLPRVRVAA